MTLPPDELALCKGGELFQHLEVLLVGADSELRSFQDRLVERGRQSEPSPEALNRAAGFYALRCLVEKIRDIGGSSVRDRTISDLTNTVRNALKDAAGQRGQHGRTTEQPDAASGTRDENPDAGE